MGTKSKTISFRVDEDAFEALREIAEERELYVDTLVAHDGQVDLVPADREAEDDESFPPTVEVPKSFVREHERLELEADHLREQLEEHKRYIDYLREQADEAEEVVKLEELDGDENTYQIG